MMREAARATTDTEGTPQPGNLFPECGLVLQVLPMLQDAARDLLIPHLDPVSCVGGGPERAAGRKKIGEIVGFPDPAALRDLIKNDGLPVYTSYQGKRFTHGVRMIGFASQLLVWLWNNHRTQLLLLGVDGELPWFAK